MYIYIYQEEGFRASIVSMSFFDRFGILYIFIFHLRKLLACLGLFVTS